MKNNRFGFTLAEMLIVIGLIGVIAALVMPTILSLIPKKQKKMHEKMSYAIEQIITQMANDTVMYPETGLDSTRGFRNLNPIQLNGQSETYSGDTKFCKLFASRFNNIQGAVNCVAPSDGDDEEEDPTPTFTTGDGVAWYVPVTDFSQGYALLEIDLNGNNEPNCYEGDEDCKVPDKYKYYITSNGTVLLEEPNATTATPYTITVAESCPQPPADGKCTSNITIDDESVTKNGNTFSNLLLNHTYTLTVTPKTGYVSNWNIKNADGTFTSNKRKITLTGYKLDTKVNVILNKKQTNCIRVYINDCTEEDFDDCVEVKINDVKIDPATEGGSQLGYYEKCGLSHDEYQVKVKSVYRILFGGYKLYPEPYTTTSYPNGIRQCGQPLTQNIRVGSEDVKMSVSVVKTAGGVSNCKCFGDCTTP